MQNKDAAMDIMIYVTVMLTTIIYKLDLALRKAKNTKFTKDLRNIEHIQLSATQRFIPLTMSRRGYFGPPFEAMLREFASILIKRSSG
jgi:hypothetical protein